VNRRWRAVAARYEKTAASFTTVPCLAPVDWISQGRPLALLTYAAPAPPPPMPDLGTPEESGNSVPIGCQPDHSRGPKTKDAPCALDVSIILVDMLHTHVVGHHYCVASDRRERQCDTCPMMPKQLWPSLCWALLSCGVGCAAPSPDWHQAVRARYGADGEGSFQVLWRDGERVFGRRRAAESCSGRVAFAVSLDRARLRSAEAIFVDTSCFAYQMSRTNSRD
jgi:hypothetical protein